MDVEESEQLAVVGQASAEQFLQDIARCRNSGDVDGVMSAVKALVGAEASGNEIDTASELVAAMIENMRNAGNKKAHGQLLTGSSQLYAAQEAGSQALDAATRAVELLSETQDGALLAGAVGAVLEAHSLQRNPQAGLRAANAEVEAARKRSDKTCEVLILECIVRSHASLGEPQSAINAAQRAVELNRALGNKEAEGSLLNTIAEMKWALSELGAASESARQSLAVFKAAQCKWGEDKARKTLTAVLGARGLHAQAPNRQAALAALRDLVKAATEKNAEDVKAAEQRLNEIRDSVSDREIVDHLGPVMQKNPEVIDFLKSCGWNLGEAKGLDGTLLRHWSHKGFYLHTLMTGMGFGPQFRSVNEPWRVGRKPEENMSATVVQLPETDSWQHDMLFRPGVIDAALQGQSTLSFP